MTPRRPIEMQRGERGSHRYSSRLPIGRLVVIYVYDYKLHGYTLFIAIWIRVKSWCLKGLKVGGGGGGGHVFTEYREGERRRPKVFVVVHISR